MVPWKRRARSDALGEKRSFLPTTVYRGVTMKGHEVLRIDTIENKSTCLRRLLELGCCKP
jgi:hypothetical protein